MAIRKFRFDTLQRPTKAPPAPQREDREPVRLRTAITFARSISKIGVYRVIAERAEGPEALICLGTTRDEALARARQLAGVLPLDTQRLCLDEWQGGACLGKWRRQRCARGELPLAPGQRRLRRRESLPR